MNGPLIPQILNRVKIELPVEQAEFLVSTLRVRLGWEIRGDDLFPPTERMAVESLCNQLEENIQSLEATAKRLEWYRNRAGKT